MLSEKRVLFYFDRLRQTIIELYIERRTYLLVVGFRIHSVYIFILISGHSDVCWRCVFVVVLVHHRGCRCRLLNVCVYVSPWTLSTCQLYGYLYMYISLYRGMPFLPSFRAFLFFCVPLSFNALLTVMEFLGIEITVNGLIPSHNRNSGARLKIPSYFGVCLCFFCRSSVVFQTKNVLQSHKCQALNSQTEWVLQCDNLFCATNLLELRSSPISGIPFESNHNNFFFFGDFLPLCLGTTS